MLIVINVYRDTYFYASINMENYFILQFQPTLAYKLRFPSHPNLVHSFRYADYTIPADV